MKTHIQYPKLIISVVLLFVSLLFGFKSNAQNQNDFWQSFEKCTQVSAFQSHYLPIPSDSIWVHTVMNHGVEIPSITGVVFTQNNTFELLDKSAIMAMQKTNFFLIHEAKVNALNAEFHLVYYYNFNGSYNEFVEATITLTKVSGNWNVSQTVIK